MLPVVFVSPPLPWMTEDGVNIVAEHLAIFTAAIYLLKLDPIECPSAPEHLVQLAKMNITDVYKLSHHVSSSSSSVHYAPFFETRRACGSHQRAPGCD